VFIQFDFHRKSFVTSFQEYSMKKYVYGLFALTMLGAHLQSFAESSTTLTATTGSTADARVDVSIVIPAVLYLRVGTGNAVAAADNGTVDAIDFSVPAANVGDSTVINASAGSGDLTNGAVTVRVFSNFGTNVTLNSSVSGQLANDAGDTIAWSEIAVAGAALSATTPGYTNGAITHPAFSGTSGNGTATTLTAVGKLVRQEGSWTYTYTNSTVPPSGTYGGTVARNGRVTYTALQL